MRLKAKEGMIKPVQEISVNGETYVVKTIIGHLSTEITFKLGVEFPSSSMDGKKIMVYIIHQLMEISPFGVPSSHLTSYKNHRKIK